MSSRIHGSLLAIAAYFICVSASLSVRIVVAAEPTSDVQFREVIAPALVTRCLACHGGEKQEGGYSLRTVNEMRETGDSELTPIVAKSLPDSELWRRITTPDPDLRMPPDAEPLSAEQIKALEAWILAGTPLASSDALKPLVELVRAKHATAPESYPRPIPINAVAPLRGGEEAMVAGYAEVTRWSSSDGKLLARIATAGTQVVALAVSSDDRLLAVSSGVAGERGAVELIRIEAPEQRIIVASTSDIAPDLAFSPDARRLIIGGHDGSLTVASISQDPPHPVTTTMLTPHADSILAVAWSGNGKQFFTASRDRTAKLFDASKIELIASIDRHERAVGGAGFAADRPLSLDETGRLRVMVGDDSDRTLTEQSRLPRVLQRFASTDASVYIPAGNALRHFTLKQERVDDGKDDKGKPKQKSVTRLNESERLVAPAGEWITSVAIDAQAVIAGTQQGHVFVWNRESGERLHGFLAKP